MQLWDNPLSEEQKAQLVDKAARWAHKRGLSSAVILALEMHKPVSALAGHGVVAFSPILAPMFGLDNIDRFSQFISDRENIERLIRRIEELEIGQEPELLANGKGGEA